jgi:hypothetical protein
MALGFAFIQQILEAGGNVELDPVYGSDLISSWVELAAREGGGTLTLTSQGKYAPALLVKWATTAKGHFTLRIPNPRK